MRSHLTTFVFRQLLHGRPITHRQCVALLQYHCSERRHALGSHVHGLTRYRSLFSWGGKRAKPLEKAPSIDPGYIELSRLDELLRMNVRPLDSEIVARALRTFFAYKHKSQSPFTDTQIRVASVATAHLAKFGYDKLVDVNSLVLGLQSLRSHSHEARSEDVLELAQHLYQWIEIRKDSVDASKIQGSFETEVVLPYLQILCSCHHPHEARALLRDALRTNPQSYQQAQFWEPIIKAFIAEKNDAGMDSTLREMEECAVPIGPDLQLVILGAFSQRGDFAPAQQWHNALIERFPQESLAADTVFLDLCIRLRRLADGESAFRRLVQTQPTKPTWDLILRWAAAKRKGVDEVERMMDVMIKRNKEAGTDDRPDVDTINGLLRLANSMDDPYMAERLVSLAEKRDIALNGNTYALQMAYRLDVDDLAGAYKAFEATQNNEVEDNADLPQIHRLLEKLCMQDEPQLEKIEELLAALHQRHGAYPAATIHALLKFWLAKGEIRKLIKLLHEHAHQLSGNERTTVIVVFMEYVLDRNNTVKAAWDAYCILREVFPELDNAARTSIMIDFFARGRADVAIHVFGHMRQAEIIADRPTAETYALCFQGVGHAGDERSFDLVYNMLKLDSAIEPDTHLRNAIMLGQIGCGFRSRALEIWDDIAFSREGPSYNSIAIALYAVETTRKRTNKGLEIWANLEKQGVIPNRQIYVAYIGALAGQGMLDEACKRVKNLSNALQEPLEAETLGVLYNAAFARQREEVVKWGETNYPQLWAELQSFGRTDGGLYQINRQLVP